MMERLHLPYADHLRFSRQRRDHAEVEEMFKSQRAVPGPTARGFQRGFHAAAVCRSERPSSAPRRGRANAVIGPDLDMRARHPTLRMATPRRHLGSAVVEFGPAGESSTPPRSQSPLSCPELRQSPGRCRCDGVSRGSQPEQQEDGSARRHFRIRGRRVRGPLSEVDVASPGGSIHESRANLVEALEAAAVKRGASLYVPVVLHGQSLHHGPRQFCRVCRRLSG